MLTLNVVSLAEETRINGSINGESFNVLYSEDLYNDLKTKQAELESIEEVDAFDAWTEEVNAIIAGVKDGDIIESACEDLMFDEKTGKYYLKVENKISKHAVPKKLVSVILESVEKQIDATPIVKAWTRFLRNPNFTSDKAELFAAYITAIIIDDDEAERLMDEEGFTYEKAQTASAYNDVAITAEGLVVTKKYAKLLTEGWVIDKETNEAVKKPLYETTKTVDQFSGEVTEETSFPEFAEELTFEPPVMGRGGNAFACGDLDEDESKEDHIIKVGKLHTLKDWGMVNTNDCTSCVSGLHSGGWRYVRAYGGVSEQLLECFVDPAEIGAICDVSEYSDGAIRSREYFVYGAVKGRTKGIYHSSKYAAKKDVEWKAYKEAAIEEANKIAAETKENLA